MLSVSESSDADEFSDGKSDPGAAGASGILRTLTLRRGASFSAEEHMRLQNPAYAHDQVHAPAEIQVCIILIVFVCESEKCNCRPLGSVCVRMSKPIRAQWSATTCHKRHSPALVSNGM
jgi:hypothetical protein